MQQHFRHEAMPYLGQDEFVPTSLTAIRDGLDNDQRTIVLAASNKIDSLRDALGPDGEDVTFIATDDHGRNPSRIATILDSFQSGGDAGHSLGINDTVVPGRSPAARLEARYSDSVLNVASLRTWPLSVLCLFDLEQLDDAMQHAMRQDHAVVRGHETNVDFDPDVALELYGTRVDPPPPGAARLRVDQPGLGRMRIFVRSHAADFGVGADRADDLVLAANEIVTNSMRHGGGSAAISMWFEDGSAVCEVRDRGHLDDPLAGRFAPPPGATSGRGLWLANHLCDLVQLRSSPAGTVVRMYVDR